MGFAGEVAIWWGTWLLLGLTSIPVTRLWLGKLWDEGYAFARLIGLAAIAYPVWLLGALHLVPYRLAGLLVVWALWAGLNVWVLMRGRSLSSLSWKWQWSASATRWVNLELLFGLATFWWARMRATKPDINGLEKFMDFGFLNANLRTDYFPPQDMWFAGKGVNYYYVGHYLASVVTRLSGLPPAVAYNLLLASLLGLLVTAAFSLCATLVQAGSPAGRGRGWWPLLGGSLAAFLVALRGNLHWAGYQVNKTLHVGWLPPTSAPYWYPDATRYVPYTIHEFPFYSFVVADLHAHFMNEPWVLLYLAGLLSIVLAGKATWARLAPLGFLLGLFQMTHTWDVPVYALVTGATLLWMHLRDAKWSKSSLGFLAGAIALAGAWVYLWVRTAGNATDIPPVLTRLPALIDGPGLLASLATAGFALLAARHLRTQPACSRQVLDAAKWLGPRLLLVGALWFLVSLPFRLKFHAIDQGIRAAHQHSTLAQLFILWGWDIFLGATLLGVVLLALRQPRREGEPSGLDAWVLVLFGSAVALVALSELVYAQDIYVATHPRANTMFKLTLQSWMMFSIAGSYALVRMAHAAVRVKPSPAAVAWCLVALVGLAGLAGYDRPAVEGFYGKDRHPVSLDGDAWFAQKYPDDFAAVEWLRGQKGQPVVLEAAGDSYTEFARISAFTGLPTVVGWKVHEWLWRADFAPVGKRADDVQTMYTSTDNSVTQGLLDQYHVRFVVVGTKEREAYASLDEGKFAQLGTKVFASGATAIYELPRG